MLPTTEMCFIGEMYCGDCSHAIIFVQDQLSSELVAVLPPGASIGTGTTVSYCSFFLDDFWGCGYFELLHGQIGMLHFNDMEMHCSSHFNMNFSKIPQSFLVNIYHHPEHQSIDPIATKYGPFLSIPTLQTHASLTLAAQHVELNDVSPLPCSPVKARGIKN